MTDETGIGDTGIDEAELVAELKSIREKVPLRLDIDRPLPLPNLRKAAEALLPAVPAKASRMIRGVIERALPLLDGDTARAAVRAEFGWEPEALAATSRERREEAAACFGYSFSHFRQRGIEEQLFAGLAGAVRGAVAANRPSTRRPNASKVPASVPRQLPAAISGFVGRGDEHDRLDDLLDLRASGGAVVITAIDGTAGAGKTTLALHWAHSRRDLFPDGDLFINLHGYDYARPVDPADALTSFLRALGVPPEEIPDDLDARAAMYRTLLHGREMLIVLDNAVTPEQVRPLLPGSPGSLVLITSRSRLSGLVARDGVRRLTLDLMTREESLALLGSIAGQERVMGEAGYAADLVTLCARLPLALRIAAERAAGRPRAPLKVFVDELRDESRRLDILDLDDEATAVRGVLDWSYRTLGPETARMFRVLGLHAGARISTGAAAALAGEGARSTDDLLRTLTGVHLLEHGDDGSYAFHDLLRVLAGEKLRAEEPEGERDAALRRMLLWYLHTAALAVGHLMPQRRAFDLTPPIDGFEPAQITAYADALDWLEHERENLVLAQRQAHEACRDDVAWQLAVVLRGFFNLRKHWDDWIATHEIALESAYRSGDEYAAGRVLNGLGTVYKQKGRIEQAIPYHQEALRLRREDSDPLGEASALDSLGNAYREVGRASDAMDCYRESLRLRTEAGHRHGEAWSLNNMGEIYHAGGDHTAALGHFEKALSLRREVADRWGEGITLHNVGLALHARADLEESARSFESAVEVRRGIGDQWGTATSLVALGDVRAARGDHPAARTCWTDALRLLDRLDDATADDVRARIAALPGR
ncbi:tetratricopeptide repeat protein [Spongiactinospora sp. TRM90649]|uniref:ATP-binding protein n=1 Tax=Spongiactinospora sp. TRM90649 TaxID=3031114 RepID=UPI0023F8F77C|nr:tetratricopeptide repeat protein [Spongiactinospora sp. TRM90649]MDF5751209.1 tetratricopeptide repeat protein [Spongiactinospora sp. TRM90649]